MYQYYEWIFSDLHETANHPLHCAPWLAVLYMDWNAVYLWECVYSRTKCFLESSGCRTRPLETSAYRPRLSDCGTNRERTLVWNGVQNPPRRSLLGGYVLILWMTMHVMSLLGAYVLIQPIADRVALYLEIISTTFPTNQNSAHGIYDYYCVIKVESHENPGTSGTKLKVFRNNLKILCHPICSWLYYEWHCMSWYYCM